jgi:4-diphosphocytidyl-2-C-methyl-D-erythritol kinase
VNTQRALAPAKINLGLWMGRRRERDGLHELVTVMQSISLADEVTLEPAPAAARGDVVVCPGVPGRAQDNLAAAAVRSFRAATGWDEGPLRVSIVKHIPVAAGLGGGSADAAATLRLLRRASGLGDVELLHQLAQELGADVPAQVSPGRWLATGAGEGLERLPDPSPPLALLVLPLAAELSTSAVYAEADRLQLARAPQALEARAQEVRAALAQRAPLPAARGLLHNDLQPAASSLCPQIAPALEQAGEQGADAVLVSGSGPTVVGLFATPAGAEQAARAAAALAGWQPAPIRASSVGERFARARPLAQAERRRGAAGR